MENSEHLLTSGPMELCQGFLREGKSDGFLRLIPGMLSRYNSKYVGRLVGNKVVQACNKQSVAGLQIGCRLVQFSLPFSGQGEMNPMGSICLTFRVPGFSPSCEREILNLDLKKEKQISGSRNKNSNVRSVNQSWMSLPHWGHRDSWISEISRPARATLLRPCL